MTHEFDLTKGGDQGWREVGNRHGVVMEFESSVSCGMCQKATLNPEAMLELFSISSLHLENVFMRESRKCDHRMNMR